MVLGAASGLSAAMTTLFATSARAGGTINFADIGVGDPDGNWSRYSKASGFNVNLVAIGNAPSAILNTLVAGGGTASYDVINIVGGMQKPLVDNNLIEVLDTAQAPNWAKDKNIGEFLGKGKPGFNFIWRQTSNV
jgi:spermidine/putrescine-binding protein